jgi:Flp pilus assembly protein TadG
VRSDRNRDVVTGRRQDAGQAAVEFAIALPLVVVLVLGIIQIVLVARDQIAIELAARDGARAAAVAADATSAADRGARSATTLRPLEVATSVGAQGVTVTVSHTNTTGVPLIGALIGDVELTASVTMAREPP